MEGPTQASREARMGALSPSMSSNERRKILRSLFLTSSPYELREFRRWIDQVDFRCDLITKLPLEIAHKILGYLPLHQSFRLRRVSKAWFRTLCAPQTVEHLLRFWYPKAEARLDVPEGLTFSAVSSLRAEHVDAYRSGTAFNVAVGRWDPPERPSTVKNVVYANGYVAWITVKHEVHWLHLESSSHQIWMPPDGEIFIHIAMSATILVATTNKAEMCHILTLADDERQSFRLASASVEMITAVGDAIAILYSRSPKSSMQVEVTIWTLKSKKTVQCRARLQELLLGQAPRHDKDHDLKIMLGTNTDYLILFERHSNPQGFHFTRFNLDGQIHSRGSLKDSDTDILSNLSKSLTPLVPSDVGGCATIWWSFCDRVIEKESSSKLTELIRVHYEPQRNQLQLTRNPSRLWWHPLIAAGLFIWKDVIYYRDEDLFKLETLELSTEDFVSGEIMNLAPSMGYKEDQLPFPGYLQVERRNYPLESAFFGDENYLVNFCDHGFLAWCFNKDTKMKWADQKYADRRREEMQKRREKQQKSDALGMEQVLRSEEIKLDITGSVGTYRELQEGQNH